MADGASKQSPPEEAVKEEVASNPKDGERRDPEPGSPSTDLSALIDAIKAEGTAYRREEQSEDRAKRNREWITIGLLACTVIAVGWQVAEMVKVYGPIRDQALAAIKQAANSEAALVASQRAWVGPQNATLSAEPTAGTAVDVVIQYQNSGRDPALGFIANAYPFAATPDDIDSGAAAADMQKYMRECRGTNKWQKGSVVYPTTAGLGGGYSMTINVPVNVVDDGIVTGNKTLIVEGCFLYRTFNKPRHSYFCYFYRHGATKIQNLNICRSGHDAD